MMKALILAAGMGSRLHHETDELPKALVKVNKRPILSYQLEAIEANGVREIVIVVGRHGERIIEYIQREFSRLDVRFVWNEEYSRSNSSYSFWLARDCIDGRPYIHFNCDIILSPGLLTRVIDSPRENVLLVNKRTRLSDNMEQVILDKDKIVKMRNYYMPEAVGKAFGVGKFSPGSTRFLCDRIGEFIQNGDKNQNYYGVIRTAVESLGYYAVFSDDDLLMEINTLSDLEKAERRLG